MSDIGVLNLRRGFVQWALLPAMWLGLITGAAALRCLAQTASVAQVSGVVRDPTGAAIAGAQVRITQIETKFDRQATSDDEGRYILPALPVGPYQLEVAANGFKTYTQSGIILQVGNNVEMNVPMQIGANAERVDVEAQAGMVETRDNTISQVIDERRISELPLNGRQLTQLVLISGAATYTPNGGFNSSRSQYGTIAISVAGGQANSLNYLLDGGDHNDLYMNVNLPLPFPDALQEFSVQTNGLPARYGLHPAAVVNAVTKSGTNEWHGNLFEFLRNGNLNARNFFAPVHDSLKRNQFGGTFGGRIIRDKLFFFGGFQGMFNRSNPQQSVAFVPTAQTLSGDFSVIDSPACVSGGRTITLVDPSNGQPFAGNQIPVGRFSQPAINLAQKYLPPAQTPCGKVNYGLITNGDEDMEILRMDWLQSTKHTVYGRYFIDDYRQPAYFDGKNILQIATPGFLERSQSITLGDTYSFSANLLNSFHATFTRRRNDRAPATNVPTPANLGVTAPSPSVNSITWLVSGYFNVGCTSCVPAFNNVNSFHFDDDVDIVRGKHQMGFGVNLLRNQGNNVTNQGVNGVYTFNGQYASGRTVGDSLAAFMLGVMNDFNQGQPVANATRQTVLGLYAQDTIRLSSRLTLNVGLRWDPALVPYDKYNGNGFSRANFDAGVRSTVFTNAPPGLLFYGDPGIPRGLQFNGYNRFSPRLGIVWDPTGSGRQTIRVSGAILRDTQETYYTNRVAANAPYGTLLDRAFPFPAGGTLANPWGGYAGGAPFPLPSPIPKDFVFPNGGVYVVMPLHGKTPYMAQWSLSYQRQITPNWLASASYLGSKTTNIWVGTDLNPGVYIPGSTAGTNQRRVLYLQNPTQGAAYAAVVQNDPNANSNYNALLLSIQHRFSHGFTWLTNYTWSHCLSDADHTQHISNPEYMNTNNRAADYGNCNFDVRHLMNTSLVVASPVKGGWLGRIFGQWQVAPIVSMQSGLPINVTTGVDVSQTIGNSNSGILDRPNLILPNAYSNSSNPTQYLNRAAFQNAAVGTFGNLGRDALNAPGAIHFDVSLTRTFRITERWQLTPRAEAFNIINHANLPPPILLLNNSQFGLITNSNQSNQATIGTNMGDPRILQFALKLQF